MTTLHAVPIQPERLATRVAAEIRALTGRFSMNQTDLGIMLGMSQSQAGKRLRGAIEFEISEIEIIANHFSIEPADIIAGNVKDPHPTEPGEGAECCPLCAARDSNPEPSD